MGRRDDGGPVSVSTTPYYYPEKFSFLAQIFCRKRTQRGQARPSRNQNHSTTDGHGWTQIRDLVRQILLPNPCPSVSIRGKEFFDQMSDSDGVQCKEHKDKKFPFCVLCVLLRPFALVAAPPGPAALGLLRFTSWLLIVRVLPADHRIAAKWPGVSPGLNPDNHRGVVPDSC